MRIYAIGDIHGRDDLLRLLHERILNDAARHPYRQKIAVYLGDYVDRGPDSCDVLERLSTRPLPDFTSIYLMGNHEQARFEFLTAIELKDDNPLPAVNLVTLSLVQDNWRQAEDLVNRLRLKPEQFAEAQARAQRIRSNGRGPLAA